jgi:MFS family permease
VGGLLTDTLGWRAIFWMLVPLTAVSLLIGVKTIPETSDENVPRRLDLSGLTLITVGIGLFTFAFDRAPSWGWLSAPTVGAFIASVVVLAAFVAVEIRVRWPLVNLSLLRNSRFTILVVAGTTANIAYTATVFLSTMNLQQVRGLDPLIAGIAFLGPSAGAALGGVISGRLASRFPPIVVMGIGCAVAAVSLAVLAGSRQWVVYLLALTACGFTMGLVYAFTTVATQAVIAPERAGEAAGVTLTSLVTFAGVGIAVSGTILEVLQHHGWSMANGINSLLAVIAALLLPAGLAVLRSARSKAPALGARDAD